LDRFTLVVAWWLSRLVGFRPGKYWVRIERSIPLKTFDGIDLVADIYHPQLRGKTPTILVRIPYSKILINSLFATVIGQIWSARGYTVVIQGTRGRYESGGIYYPFHSERADGIATMDWLAQQLWYNGYVGTWGSSYFGYTQWVLADRINPGLSALIIQISSTDFYRMFYPGGAFSFQSALYWAVTSYGKKDIPATAELLKKGFSEFPAITADERVVKNIGFFKDWASHPQKDRYWEQIDGVERNRNLQAPVLLMAGWYDPFLPTQIDDFLSIRRHGKPEVAKETRLIVGPWTHAHTVTFPNGYTPRNYRLESIAPSIPWFDRHLTGTRETSFDAPLRIYVMGKNVWRDEPEWPLKRTQYTNYYLHSKGRANSLNGDGKLNLSLPSSIKQSCDTFIYDPLNPVPTVGGTMLGPDAGIKRQNDIEAREDILIYTTASLTTEVEVTGPVRLILYVTTTAIHTDFTAKLVDVYPDGSAYNISEGILRQEYYDSAQPTQIYIDLWPTSQVFFPGHQIRLEVSSSNYPRFDRNPNTGGDIAIACQVLQATQSIYHSPEMASRLILPIIPL
jgi:putative CocE/NonD family hydrolase